MELPHFMMHSYDIEKYVDDFAYDEQSTPRPRAVN